MRSQTVLGHPTSRHRILVIAILSFGAALRLVQYFASSSLWVDELFIALNVTRRGWSALLFGPLEYRQVAPIGFLTLEKLATMTLGNTELALRFFPTLFSLVSLVLFWRVSRRFLERGPLLAALSLFAINPVLLWTARNAKQYSGDVMVSLLLVLLALRFREERDDVRAAAVAGIVGGTAILLSQPAVLLAGGLWIILLFQQRRSRQPLLPLAPLGVGWGVGAAVVGITSLVLAPPSTRQFMQEGWDFAFVAMPWQDPLSLPHLLFRFVSYLLGSLIPDSPLEITVSVTLLGLILLGGWRLARRTPAEWALVVSPLLIAILASAAWLLPFSGRVSAYTSPALVIAFSAGLVAIGAWLPSRVRAPVLAIAFCLAAAPALAQMFLMPPFYNREHARPTLEEVRERWQPGDVLYTLHGGRPALRYYGNRLGLPGGLAGKDHGFAPRAYLREVDALRGHPRAWFFFTHAKRCEPETVLSYLDSIGTVIHRIEDRHGNQGKRESAAYLYDLSDADRLARSNAERHPVPKTVRDCERTDVSQEAIIKGRLRGLVSRLLPRRPARKSGDQL